MADLRDKAFSKFLILPSGKQSLPSYLKQGLEYSCLFSGTWYQCKFFFKKNLMFIYYF